MNKSLSATGGIYGWLFQRISGVVLIILLCAHFIIMHYFADGEVSYDIVKERLANPFWKTFDMTFLSLALYHGLNGAWSVVQDYFPKPVVRIIVFSFLCCLGLILLVLGTITIVPFKA